MTQAILELTTMSISKGFDPFNIHSNNNRHDNITITSATTAVTDGPLDPSDNPIYELARAMFLNSSEPDLDYDAFLERKTNELTKIRKGQEDTEASKLLSKHWKYHHTVPDLTMTQSTLESTQQSSLFLSQQDWSQDELDNSILPTVVSSQQEQPPMILQDKSTHKRKKEMDKEKDKKKKKKKLKPGFM